MRNRKWVFTFILSISILYSQAQKEFEIGRDLPENRGLYFPISEYVSRNVPLPTFEGSKSQIPVPILEDNKDWIDMYWFCWEEAFKKLKKPPEGSPLVADFIDEAFSDYVYQWDTHFMILFWKYLHHVFPSIQSHDNFYRFQHPNGYICREISEIDGGEYYYEGKYNSCNPPLYPWVEWEYYKITGDYSRFATILPALEKYAEWINIGRHKSGTAHDLYWNSPLGSGMDNVPRSGSGWICMSSQMTLYYHYMSKICEKTGQIEKANKYAHKSNEVSEKINFWLWNHKDGMYYDVDDQGNQVKIKTIASFWPMLAGICSSEQADKLTENLMDSTTFWRTIPFPTLSADHHFYDPMGNYWIGGVWSLVNYMVIKGLEKYNKDEFAYQATKKYLDGMYAVFNKTNTVWENYAPDSLSQGNHAKPDFVGFTGIGPTAMLIENIIGIRLDAINNTVNWYIQRTDKHGIENIVMEENTITLICQRREFTSDEIFLEVTAEKPFQLKVHKNDSISVFQIETGKNKIQY